MTFIGSRGIVGHSITLKPIQEQTCRQLAYNIKNNLKHNLQQFDPYTYVNKTNTVTNYIWYCKSLYYTFIFPFLTYGIEFWGQAAAYRIQPLRVV